MYGGKQKYEISVRSQAGQETNRAYRITAENRYRSILDRMHAKGMTEEDERGLEDLRTNLDDLCRYQSKWAPDDYPLKGAT